MLIKETKRVVEQLPGARGCLTVQCFVPESPAAPARPLYIEINPRFGGGVPLSIEAGGLFPEWIVRLLTDDVPREERMAWQSSWVDGLVMLRYDDAVFIRGVDDE
jgi:carbamoyl-phosphate synthase large subunit